MCDRAGYINNCNSCNNGYINNCNSCNNGYGNRGKCSQCDNKEYDSDRILVKKELHYVETYLRARDRNVNEHCNANENDSYGYGCCNSNYNNGYNNKTGFTRCQCENCVGFY